MSSAKVSSRPTDLGSGRRLRDRREAAPEGELAQAVRAAPERRREDGERHVLEHADGGEAEGGEALCGDRPDAVEVADRQVAQPAADVGLARARRHRPAC